MLAIFNREFLAYLNSLVAYIAIGLFLLISGFFLWAFPENSVFEQGYADMNIFFKVSPLLFIFLIPALCMRSIADERRENTFLLLVTRPISISAILAAKFAAVLALVLCTLVFSLVFVFALWNLASPVGNIDLAAILGSYLGLFLIASSFVALGILASALTKNQILAFTLGAFLCYFFYYASGSFAQIFEGSLIADGFQFLSLQHHFEAMSRGLIDLQDVVYILGFNVLIFISTELVLRFRKW